MRFDKYSEKIAVNGFTLLLQGYPISDKERLHILRGISTSARTQGNEFVWHQANNIIKNYEKFTDFKVVDSKFIVKWGSKLGLPIKEEEKTPVLD